MKKNNIPDLRFPQFNEPWTVKKLGEVCERIKDGTHGSHKEVSKGKYLLSAKDIKNGRVICSSDSRIISEEDFNSIHKNYKIENGDVLLTLVGTIGQSAIVQNYNENYTFQRSVGILKVNKTIFNKYLFQLISSSSFQSKLVSHSNSSAQAGVYLKTLSSLPISLPSLPEQQKIADFLSGVDEKIGQLERQLALEEQYKKGMMQRLFDQEIRFKDENGNEFPDWEEKSAGDLFYSHTNKNHNGDLPILAITQDRGAVLRDEIDYTVQVTEQSIKTYKIIEPGDFIISLRSFQGGIEYSNVLGISSPAYTVLKPSLPIINIFYKYYLKKDSFIQALSNTVEGIRDGKNISYKNFSVLTLPYPSLPEQQKIADFLSSLDDKIGQTKAELEKARDWKRGLMQRMFV